MNIREQIEYGAVAGLLNISRCIPEGWVYGLYHVLGALAYILLGRRRKTAFMNTSIVFPGKSVKERREIVWQHFLNLSESLALNTLIMSGRISNERLVEMVDAPDWDHLADTVNTTPRGILFFSAHIGNWELMPLYAALRLKKTFHIITRKTNNALIEERIMLPMRKRFGMQVFYKKNAILKIMQATRKGESAGIMVDQKLNLQEGIAHDFFGRTAGTTVAPALFQVRFGIITQPAFMIRTGRQKYRLIVGDPVHWEDNGKPMEDQVAELTAVHQKMVEQIILEYPEQWFWVHDRWGLWKQSRKK